jgi:hypothetical protein
MTDREDDALRQRLQDENLARASCVRPRFEPAPPLPVARAPRELPPNDEYLRKPVATSTAYEDELARRRGRLQLAAIAVLAIIVGAVVRWALGGAL